MNDTAFGVLLMDVGSGIMNLGFCLQQKGGCSYPDRQAVYPTRSRARVFLTHPVWLAGIGLNVLGVVFTMLAVGFAPYTLIAPVRVTGLLTLILFSWLILGERLSRVEGMGMLLAASCTVALGFLCDDRSTLHTLDQFNEKIFSPGPCVLTASLLLSACCLWAVASRRGYRYAGSVFGFWGGVTAAIGIVYSKGLALGIVDGLGQLLSTPRGIVTLVLSQFGVLTLIGSQVGYQHARAVIMVPVINVLGLVIPILYGVAFLGEWRLLAGDEMLIQAALLSLLIVAVIFLSCSR